MSIQLHGNIRLVNMQKVVYTIKSVCKKYNRCALTGGNGI